jgi:hypothetical protein
MQAEIQILQLSPDGQTALSSWMTIQTVEHHPISIQNAMAQAKQQYPAFRVRAVEQHSGRLIDILM